MIKNDSNNSNRGHLLSHHFKSIDEASIEEILGIGNEVKIKTGEYLFNQGDKADELYILLSGRLRAIKQEEDKSLVVLGDIGPGEPVGEFAFFYA